MMTDTARLCAETIRERLSADIVPQIGLILGSGLGALANETADPTQFPYTELPGFPASAIEGQHSRLTAGRIERTPVVCLEGRAHYYEGCDSSQILTYVRTLKLLGCHTVIVTGAVGSLHAEVKPGQLILLRDHINFLGRNPLAGVNDPAFGPRFPDMSEAYDRAWRRHLEKLGHELTISLMEGVYVSVLGPNFETPAEIQVFRAWGADVIGMSVVPEVLAARHCGLRVIGLTVVTNLAAGLTTTPQSHEETLCTAELSTTQMIRLLRAFMASV
jgi:purine-nucleoside phosphorylase